LNQISDEQQKQGLDNVQEAVEEEELDYIDGTQHMVSSSMLLAIG